jgi:hypothetical protein
VHASHHWPPSTGPLILIDPEFEKTAGSRMPIEGLLMRRWRARHG